MTFFEFLRDKLLYPLASTSLVFISIFKAIGEMFDLLITDAWLLALEWFPLYSKNIELHAIDRNITVLPGENSESFRTRVAYAFSFYKRVKTVAGIKNILSYYLSEDFSIAFVNNEPFAYYIILNEILTTQEKENIYNVLDKYKKAHVKIYLMSDDYDNKFIIGESFIGEIRI